MLIFGIAFGEPPVAKDFAVISRCILGSLCNLSAGVAKCLVWGIVGLRVCTMFANLEVYMIPVWMALLFDFRCFCYHMPHWGPFSQIL